MTQSKSSAHRVYEMYYHHFPHLMLTQIESLILHVFLLSFVFFVGYGVYTYLPSSMTFALSRSYYYVWGNEA